jgi:hypothetical protein
MASKYAELLFHKKTAVLWLASRRFTFCAAPSLVIVGKRGLDQFEVPSSTFLGVRARSNTFLASRCIRWKSDAAATEVDAKPLTGVLFNEKLTGSVLSKEEQAKANLAEVETETEEERKKRESSWRMMKYSFIFFGFTFASSMLYIVYDWGEC